MQNRKRDTDVYNRLLDSVGEGEGGMFQENSIETLQYSCLENPMGRGIWQATVHRVSKSHTQLNRFSTHTQILKVIILFK